MNKQTETAFPLISTEVIKELNARFPEMCADLSWEERQVWFASGQRSVIRFLNEIFKQQQENALGSK